MLNFIYNEVSKTLRIRDLGKNILYFTDYNRNGVCFF